MIFFMLWIFVYVQFSESGPASPGARPERMGLPGEASRVVKRHNSPKPPGWLWCSEDNATLAFKLCPGDPYLEECLTVTMNASRHNVVQLMQGSWSNIEPATKNWALCYLSKNGVMSPSGVLRQDVVLRTIPDHDKGNVEDTINKCLYKTAHDPVETAWNYLTCFRYYHPGYAKFANRI